MTAAGSRLETLESILRMTPAEAEACADQDTPQAAVALVFRPGESLLFIQRAERAGDPWSGHMAFPGGRAEPQDPSLIETAMRETFEEIGLDLGTEGRCIGRLPTLSARFLPLKIAVHPFIFVIEGDPPLSPNVEVAACHWLPLTQLLEGQGRTMMPYVHMGVEVQLPCIPLGRCCIWGMTLRMIDDLLGLLDGPLGTRQLATDGF